MSNAWVRRFSARPQAKARLFCFSYAGAGASVPEPGTSDAGCPVYDFGGGVTATL